MNISEDMTEIKIKPYFHQLINAKEYLIELESVTAISDVYMRINSDNGLPPKNIKYTQCT